MNEQPIKCRLAESYLSDKSPAEIESLSREMRALFLVLYQSFKSRERFDSTVAHMVESDSPKQPNL